MVKIIHEDILDIQNNKLSRLKTYKGQVDKEEKAKKKSRTQYGHKGRQTNESKYFACPKWA